MSTLFIVALYLISAINGAPCIPADTCWQSKSSSLVDQSLKYTCSGGKVTRHLYSGCTDCSCSSVSVKELSDGINLSALDVLADGSSSGSLHTDLIQGANCPTLTSSASSCTEFMMVRKYGTSGYSVNDEDLPYQDIGTDCVNKGDTWDQVLLPIGCADLFTGYNIFSCSLTDTPNVWAYEQYSTSCAAGGGTYRTAQSDSWTANECATFSERTHCGGNSQNSQTICSTGGVLVEYDYYTELSCCGDCDFAGNAGGSSSGSNTPSPTDATSAPTDATPGPTTAVPTDANGTGRPTTPAPTAIPGSNPGSGANQLKCIVAIFVIITGLLF